MNDYLPPNFSVDDDIATCPEEEAGLLFAGYDEDGEKEWLGTKEQFNEAARLAENYN